jgi:hypothetical protein
VKGSTSQTTYLYYHVFFLCQEICQFGLPLIQGYEEQLKDGKVLKTFGTDAWWKRTLH